MHATRIRALTLALTFVATSGARIPDDTPLVHTTISSVEYLGQQYEPGQNVPIFRGVAADIVVFGQFVDLSTRADVVTTDGAAVTDVNAQIISRQSSRVTVRVTGASTAVLRAYRILLRYTVEVDGPDKFLVRLFEHGTVNSVSITNQPALAPNIFAAGQVLSLRVQGTGLQRAVLRPSSNRLLGMVVVDTACGACTNADRTFKVRFDSARTALFTAGTLVYDGTLGFVPDDGQCGTMCYGGPGQLTIVIAIKPQVTSASPANPAIGTTVTLNGFGLQPEGYSRSVLLLTKYRAPGVDASTAVTPSGSGTTLTFNAPANVRPDSIILAFPVSGPNPDVLLGGVVNVPAINVTGEGPVLQRLDSLGPSTFRRAFIKTGSQVIRGKHLAKGTLVLGFGSKELTVSSAGYRANDSSVPGQLGADSVAFTVTFPNTSFSDTTTRDLTLTTQTGTAQLSSTAFGVMFVPPPSVTRIQTCGEQNVCSNIPLSGATLVRGKRYHLAGQALRLRASGAELERVAVRVNGVTAETFLPAISPGELGFIVPPSASSGLLSLTGSGGSLSIGPFTVIDPPTAVDLAGFSLSPNNVPGGQAVTATVAINGTIPPGGSAGNIFFSFGTAPDSAIQLPTGFLAVNSNPFVVSIPTRSVTAQRSVSIRIQTDPNATPVDILTAALTLRPPAPTALSLAESAVTGGRTVRTVVRLNTSVPAAAGIPLALSSSDPTTATVPASVVMSGDSVVFNVTAAIVPADRQVTITASSGGETRSATLTVKTPALAAVAAFPDTIVPGATQGQAQVTLTGDVAIPTSVPLTCDPNLICPASVTIPSGTRKLEVPFNARTVATKVIAPISATFNGVTKTADISIKPLAIHLATSSPDTVRAGSSSSITVQLNAAVPTGQSATVSFTSSDPSVIPSPGNLTFSPGERVKLRNVPTVGPQTSTRIITLTVTLTQSTNTGVNTSSDPAKITVIP